MLYYQTTIEKSAICCGVGIHSGQMVSVQIMPSEANSGIVFIRTDLKRKNVIKADYRNVSKTSWCTVISNDSTSVSTIEHFMAAVLGLQIDNLIIKINGPEMPIMDGSSICFVRMLEEAGIRMLNTPRKYLKIVRPITVSSSKATISAYPSNDFIIDMNIDFATPAIGKQKLHFNYTRDNFKNVIASARTFGHIEDLEVMQSHGLALGASLNNAIGIKNHKVLNKLRFKDEFVRHKILDTVGDLGLAGPILGYINCDKSGHTLNHALLHHIFNEPDNYEWTHYSERLDTGYENANHITYGII